MGYPFELMLVFMVFAGLIGYILGKQKKGEH
jgi:cbb3-type cytochrome oxidase subunit 3